MGTTAIGFSNDDHRWVSDRASELDVSKAHYVRHALRVYRRISGLAVGMQLNEAKLFEENVDGDRYEITVRRIAPRMEVR